MNVNLMGVQVLDFVNEKGEKVQGITLHICYKDQWVTGLKCDTKFLSKDLCSESGVTESSLTPFIGKSISVETNFKGKVVGVTAG